MLSQAAFDIVFGNTLIDSSTLHGAIVVIDGKIWMDRHYNRFIFPDKRVATRAFYNYMKWYTYHQAYRHSAEHANRDNPRNRWSYIGENGYLFTAEEFQLCSDWRSFKRELINNHNFQIIEI